MSNAVGKFTIQLLAAIAASTITSLIWKATGYDDADFFTGWIAATVFWMVGEKLK